MKRLLAIFVLLLLVLGGLFWWRKKTNYLDYNSSISIPLVNNFLIFNGSDLLNKNTYQDLLNYKKWQEYKISDLLTGNHRNYIIEPEVVKFTVIENVFYCYTAYMDMKSGIPEIRFLSFPLSNFSGFDSREYSNPPKGEINLYLNEFKTYHEWLSIWKRDGRLPWFPEHVGK